MMKDLEKTLYDEGWRCSGTKKTEDGKVVLWLYQQKGCSLYVTKECFMFFNDDDVGEGYIMACLGHKRENFLKKVSHYLEEKQNVLDFARESTMR